MRDDTIVGIVSAYDLIKGMEQIKTIEEIMQTPESVLFDSANAKDAIVMMAKPHSGSFQSLTSLKKVIGLVTRGTLLSALSSQWTELEATK